MTLVLTLIHASAVIASIDQALRLNALLVDLRQVLSLSIHHDLSLGDNGAQAGLATVAKT